GDAATIELATVQFAGTEAAGEAHQWLGDRALAGGAFTRALLEYERAGQSDVSLAAGISPRIRLVAAMLGRDAQSAATMSVQLGDDPDAAADRRRPDFRAALVFGESAAGLPRQGDGQAALDGREPRPRVSGLRSAARTGAARRPRHPDSAGAAGAASLVPVRPA